MVYNLFKAPFGPLYLYIDPMDWLKQQGFIKLHYSDSLFFFFLKKKKVFNTTIREAFTLYFSIIIY
jgi:hypothetical protein